MKNMTAAEILVRIDAEIEAEKILENEAIRDGVPAQVDISYLRIELLKNVRETIVRIAEEAAL